MKLTQRLRRRNCLWVRGTCRSGRDADWPQCRRGFTDVVQRQKLRTRSRVLPLSLRIFLNWSLFSLLAVLDPRLLSPYPDHLLPHHSKLQTVLFNIHHPAFGINSLTLSVSLIHILVFRLLTTLHESDPHCHLDLCHHQSLLLFFTVDLKHTYASSLFHRRLHHFTGLISRTPGLTVFFCSSVLF